MTLAAPRRLTLLSLAWPLFVEQGLRVLMQTVDVFMVSHVSDGAVAALGVAGQLVNLAIMLFGFVGVGSSVVMTHHLGAGDAVGAARIARTAVAVNGWVGLVVAVALAALAGPLLRLLQLPAELLPFALPFLTIVGGSLALEAVNVAASAVLRAHGFARDAMVVAFAQNVVNAVGNLLLIFGLLGFPRLGVTGVAISGAVSRLVALGALALLVHRRTRLRLRAADMVSPPGEVLRRILHLGLPIAGENVCWSLAMTVTTSFVARMGAGALAVQSYALQISTWVVVMGSSIAFASQILVGHQVGTGALEEAYRELFRNLRTALLLVMGGMVVVAALAPQLLGLFTGDPAIVATGAVVLRLGLLLEPGRISNLVVINALRATGDARFPVLFAMGSMWGVWVFLAWLLGLKLGLGLPGVWLAMSADEGLRAVFMIQRWRRRRWLEHAVRSRAAALGSS